MKTLLKLFFVILPCIITASCATQALWEATDPHQYVAFKNTPANMEKLKTRNVWNRVDEKKA